MSEEQSADEWGAQATERVKLAVGKIVRRAKGEQADQDVKELADALGVPTDTPWQTLLSLATGAGLIANRVVNSALPASDPAVRAELLATFGAAEQWARVALETERQADRAGFLDQLRPEPEGDKRP